MGNIFELAVGCPPAILGIVRRKAKAIFCSQLQQSNVRAQSAMKMIVGKEPHITVKLVGDRLWINRTKTADLK